MRGLHAAETPLHLEAISQLAFGNARLQSYKCFFDLRYKAIPDGFSFSFRPAVRHRI
jgi:hypothetical protein